MTKIKKKDWYIKDKELEIFNQFWSKIRIICFMTMVNIGSKYHIC